MTCRKLLTIVAAVVCAATGGVEAACGPGYQWTYAVGATGDDAAHAMASDGAGNVYLAGQFVGTVNFDSGGSDIHVSNGGMDVFVTKLAADGTHLWTRSLGGSDDDLAEGLAVDGEGNVYVIGIFRAADVDFDPTGGVDLRSSNGSADVFLLRLDTDGSYAWCGTIGGVEFDHGKSAAIGPADQVVMVGYFGGSNVDFDPTQGTDFRSSAGSSDIFVTQLGLDGQYGWTRVVGGGDLDTAFAVATDSVGQLVVAGWFRSEMVDFDPSAGEDWHACNSATDAYVTKLGADGSYEWTRTFGGAELDYSYALAAVVDGGGDVYVAGDFRGSDVDFDPGLGQDLRSSAGASDAFVSKLGADGSYQFCRTFGGPLYDVARGLAVDSYGGLLIAGGFAWSNVDFDNGPGSDLHSSNGLSDIFLTRLGLDGSYRWTRTVGGLEADCAYAVDLISGGDIVLAGYFHHADVDFDPTAGTDQRSSAGLGDVFATVWAGPVGGDFDCDGDVDLADFAGFAKAFGNSGGPPDPAEADLDGDGDCDLDDYGVFWDLFSGPQ